MSFQRALYDKSGAQARWKIDLNVPIQLHGHKLFVQSSFSEIERIFEDAGFDIEQVVAVIDSSLPNYEGWKKCGLPNFLLGAIREPTSYCVEYKLVKVWQPSSEPQFQVTKTRLSLFQRYLHYGAVFIVWKVFSKLTRPFKVN